MEINITLSECDLNEFFHSIISHSYRLTVKRIFESGNLNWKSYWDIPEEARLPFVGALLYAEMYPTPAQLAQILLREKRKGTLNLILNHDKWWISTKIIDVIKRAFALFTNEEYQKIYKRISVEHLVVYSTSKQLPPLIGDRRWEKYRTEWGNENYNNLKTIFESRLK
jgi:hypothetical protein